MATSSWSASGDRLLLAGPIDQYFDLSRLTADVRARVRIIDFGKVPGLNSIGVQRFLDFLGQFSERRLIYAECGPGVLGSLLVLPVLLGVGGHPAYVTSFYLSYSCEPCAKEQFFRIEATECLSNAVFEVPRQTCTTCRSAMISDIDGTDCLSQLAQHGAFTP